MDNVYLNESRGNFGLVNFTHLEVITDKKNTMDNLGSWKLTKIFYTKLEGNGHNLILLRYALGIPLKQENFDINHIT